jgi:hypothetical protein
MFRGGKSGFGSWTKTGRRMQYGAAVGSAMARGGSKSNNSNNSEEPSCFFTFMVLLMCALLLDAIARALKEKQLQPQ